MAWAVTHTFSVGEILTAANMNLIQNNINATNPVGKLSFVISGTAGSAVESVWQGGWLECNGAAVSRATYATLYNYLASLSPTLPFGTGNGSTTFNVADLRGRSPIHKGGHTDVATLGNNDGVIDANRRPKHRHTPHVHTVPVQGSTGATNGVQNGLLTSTINTSAADGGSGNANDSLDASPYLVAGIWVVKF